MSRGARALRRRSMRRAGPPPVETPSDEEDTNHAEQPEERRREARGELSRPEKSIGGSHQPIKERRLVRIVEVAERRREPFAPLEHLARDRGVGRLVPVAQGVGPEPVEEERGGGTEEGCLGEEWYFEEPRAERARRGDRRRLLRRRRLEGHGSRAQASRLTLWAAARRPDLAEGTKGRLAKPPTILLSKPTIESRRRRTCPRPVRCSTRPWRSGPNPSRSIVAADCVASSGPTCAAGEPITKAFSWVPPPEGRPRGVPPGGGGSCRSRERGRTGCRSARSESPASSTQRRDRRGARCKVAAAIADEHPERRRRSGGLVATSLLTSALRAPSRFSQARSIGCIPVVASSTADREASRTVVPACYRLITV
jgi:hypothetical protein